MLLPSKLKSGEKFKDTVVKRINQIIDYLKTQRLSGDLKTIKINQNTSGITISALPQSASANSGGGSGAVFNFPFKMSFVTNAKEGEETEVNPQYFLSIQEGRVQINDYTNSRSYFVYSGDKKISLSSLGAGQYFVVALIQFQPFGANDAPQEANRYFSSRIFFTSASATTVSTPQTRGIFSIPIGKIKLSTEDGVKKYEVIEQKIIGDFNIDFQALRLPFSVTATFPIADGDFINNINFDDFTFYLNKGNFYFDKKTGFISQQTLSITGASYVYLEVTKDAIGSISVSDTTLEVYDQVNKIYRYLIATIYFDTGTGVVIQQNATSDLTLGQIDTYKILTKDQDTDPKFISDKIDFQDYTEDDYKGLSQYIGKEFRQYEVTVGQTKSKGFNLVPRWLYKNISGFTDGEKQVLTNDKGALKWEKTDDDDEQGKINITVQGSLSGYIDIQSTTDTDQDDNKTTTYTLSFKPQGGGISKYSFLTISATGSLQHWTPNVTGTGVVTFGTTPSVITAPAPSGNITLYALTGVNGSLSWTETLDPQYFGMVKLDPNDSFDYVQNKLTSDSASITTSLSITGNLISIDIQTGYFMSSDDSITFETITEHLDLTVPNLGKIKLTDDGNLGFLQDKLIVDSSIASLLKLEVVGQQLLIKSAIEGSGLLKVENGVVSVLSAPSEKSVLVGDATGFSWMGIADCQSACTPTTSDDPTEQPTDTE